MAIKFEKIEAGMTLIDIHSERAGNTTMRRIGTWEVLVKEVVDRETTGANGRKFRERKALVSWNGNRPEWWSEYRLTKLYREDSPAVKRARVKERSGW